MVKTALITGASHGIGLELARVFAENGYQLVLVARNSRRLREIKDEFQRTLSTSVDIIAKDLSEPDAPRELFAELTDRNLNIDALVNNAGYGWKGQFAKGNPDTQLDMIDLNVRALTYLTRLALPSMVAAKGGYILNVASTAAFQPGPLMAVYYATKAYVLSFSEAIGNEVREYGITVTTLCPGPTSTEFASRANMSTSRLFQGSGVMDAKTVAKLGYEGMMKGRTIVIPGVRNQVLAASTRFAPRRAVTRIARSLNEG
ncbi:SDR family oxidoreductase [Alicyclobacillus fastidiosus]|uniref:SDR family oxidoreductase n=2 Tax=Alicyclobacillus fastidiosus TaxID=392011 RepID=A0ABY6ZI27_9BACL|nr:SDR family oxidoreductase [Alicyclobacillus fastidiosus]WAH42507.1 SDR family oxidoreductase [Alicyclobacillus fastidiosus]GMA64347.1 short-chain dehydrogenase [Alicyclobacillus fastidiosus]